MTPNEIELVRETWKKVTPIADTAARIFYQRLFEIDPSARPLFESADMNAQGHKLLEAMRLVVENAGNLGGITPVLEELGRRHVSYGVRNHHYDSVGAALFWTFEQALRSDFTEAVRAAWVKVYVHVSGAMRRAAQGMTAPRPKHARFAQTAAAICLTLGLAGGLVATTSFIASTEAHAFGWSDIKKGVSKAGGAVVDAGKKVGGVAKDTAKAIREADKTVRKAARDATIDVISKGTYGVAGETAKVFNKARGTYDAKEHERIWGGAAEEAAADAKKAYDGVKGTVKDATKGSAKDFAKEARDKALTGKITRLPPSRPGQWGKPGGGGVEPNHLDHRSNRIKNLVGSSFPTSQQSKITLQNGSRTEWKASKGAKAPVKGITKGNLKPAKGQQSKITLKKGALGNDRSIWGRPVGTKKPAPVTKGAGQKRTTALRKGRPEQQRPNKRPPSGKPNNVPKPQGSRLPQPRPRPRPPYGGYPKPRAEQKTPQSTLQKVSARKAPKRIVRQPAGIAKTNTKPRLKTQQIVRGKAQRIVRGNAKRIVRGKTKQIIRNKAKQIVRRPAGMTKANTQPRRKAQQIIRNKAKRIIRSRDLRNRKNMRRDHRANSRNRSQNRKVRMQRGGDKRSHRNNRRSGRRNRK